MLLIYSRPFFYKWERSAFYIFKKGWCMENDSKIDVLQGV
ncbi:hypothetical protein KIS1582_2030 [Cytobacillus firmus]|uniref:Uncharacterized protein n=1 Tax=Cytobacillus firmus TaxID=1399 RepID=A0A800NB51_CYTFI|nr:hypothetical protein KIS1582_2030 [Cytobacillus firmus]